MDFPAILEEIALEGLDGITVNALWKRLDARAGFVKTNLDQDSKNFIWKHLSSVSHLQFYILPVPRADLIIFKYSDYISSEECKCFLPPDTPDDIYSDTQIDQDDTRGSCDYYKERVNVTAEVRDQNGTGLLTLDKVLERWGESFVMVASQKQRNLALFDCAFMPAGLSAEMYCTLEAVGRARYEGEITSCRYLRGLSVPKFKKLSQMRLHARLKELDMFGLVAKQQFTLRYAYAPNSIVQVRLIHLRRFFSLTKANYRGYLEIVSRYLMSKPNYTAVCQDMLNDLGITTGFFKALRKKYVGYFSSEIVSYTSIFPDCNPSDSKTRVGVEKRVRIVKLLKCYEDTDALDDEDDDAESADDDESAVSLKAECGEEKGAEETQKKAEKKESSEIFVKPYGSVVYHRSLLSQVMMAIQESGERGIMEREITHKLNLKRSRIRHCMKELLKKKSFASIAKSYGRQNGSFYVTHEVAARLKDKKKKLPTIKPEKPPVVATKEKDAESAIQDEQALLDLDEKLKSLHIILKVERAEVSVASDNKKEESERKKLRRAYIIKHLTEVKAVNTVRTLFLDICQYEKEQGLKEVMCRKSFKNILTELYKEGKLYYINIFEQDNPDKMVQQMVVEPNTGVNDVRVKQALLFTPSHCMRHKYKHSASATPPKPKPVPKRTVSDSQPSTSQMSSSPKSPMKPATEEPLLTSVISVCDMLDKNIKPAATVTPLKIPKGRPGKYGSMAKFERVQVLHRYIFYLLYDYKGEVTAARQEEPESPTVYLDVEDWRRYLPPLKKHNAELLYGKDKSGVCMVGDLILHMPVHIFCGFVNIRWEVPGLREILDHPYKKFYPIDVLPSDILSQLLLKRQYLTRVKDVLMLMCQMGLLTFGPKTSQREREFSTIYLHTKAMLLDTRKSVQGNIMTHCPEGKRFEVLKYHFLTMDELNRYWADLKVIGIHSRLGSIGVEDVLGNHGESSLSEACQLKFLDDVEEDNWLPGDRRGAAGLDSSLFVHKSNNWTLETDKKRLRSPFLLTPSLSAESIPETGNTDVPSSSQAPARTEISGENSAAISHHSLKLKRQRKKSVTSKPKEAPVARLKSTEARKTRIPTKKIKKPKRKDDDKDKQAKLQMGKLRSSFTPLENGMLLLFQVTSCILSPNTLSPCVSAIVFRDILQKYLPESKDKTTNALKGKSVRLLRDKKFRGYLASYISQALSDEKIRSKLGSSKRPNIFSAEMERLFIELFDVVKHKFSSPHTQAVYLPGSVSELTGQYIVKHTEDILYNNPKLDINIKSVNDIKTMVVWELIESFLHLKTPLEGKSVFFTLSKYPNEVISEAYYLLRKYSIIVKMKKFEKDTVPVLTNNSALLNNHKCMLRHKEALKSRMPQDLFVNILKQLQEFQMSKIKAKSLDADDETLKTLEEKQTASEVAMDVDALEESAGCLRASSTVDLGIGVTSAGSSGVNSTAHPDKGIRRREATDEYVELNINKYQGGCVMAVISLIALDMVKVKAHIPDEMVRIDEDGKKKLSFKQPQTEIDRKRKLAALMDSDEDSMDQWAAEDGGSKFGHQRKGMKLSERPTRTRKKLKVADSTSVLDKPPAVESVQSEDKTIQLGRMTLSLRDVKISASGVLGNFTVWVGSGSLLTLARTSIIEKLDLLTSRCLLQRNFIVESMTLKLALIPIVQPSSICESVLDDDGQEVEMNQATNDNEGGALPHSMTTPEEPIKEGHEETSLSQCIDLKTMKTVLSHLERCYSPDMVKDDMEAIIDQRLPPALHHQGKVILKIIDSAGIIGITEEDLEVKMTRPFSHLKKLIHHLIMADVLHPQHPYHKHTINILCLILYTPIPYYPFPYKLIHYNLFPYYLLPYNLNPYNPIPYNLIPYNLIPYNLIPYNLIPYYPIPYNLNHYNLIPYNLIPYNLIPYNLIPYNLIPYNLIPYYPIPYNLNHYNLIPYNLIPYNLIPYNIIPYNIIPDYSLP